MSERNRQQGQARRQLAALGRRRKKRQEEDAAMALEIKGALEAARVARVPMEEAAGLLGMNRTTLYQVYLDSPERREPEPA